MNTFLEELNEMKEKGTTKKSLENLIKKESKRYQSYNNGSYEVYIDDKIVYIESKENKSAYFKETIKIDYSIRNIPKI